MDSTGPPAALTVLYTNIASPAAKPPSSTPSRPPHDSNDGTGGNQTKYRNKNHNSGIGGAHNGKNTTGGGGRGDSSSQSIAPTGSNGRTNAPWPNYGHPWQGHMTMYPGPVPAPWPTYGHPWQGHMTMYPGPVPARQQRLQAFVATPGLYASPGPLSGPQQQQQPQYQQAVPGPGWNP
jgi:hypothetical protein